MCIVGIGAMHDRAGQISSFCHRIQIYILYVVCPRILRYHNIVIKFNCFFKSGRVFCRANPLSSNSKNIKVQESHFLNISYLMSSFFNPLIFSILKIM